MFNKSFHVFLNNFYLTEFLDVFLIFQAENGFILAYPRDSMAQ